MIDSHTRRMIAALGADFAVNKKPLPFMSKIKRAVTRNKLTHYALLNDLHPCEFPEGGESARLTILWPSFTRRDHLARATMRRALMGYGLNDDEVAHVWAVPHDLREPPLPADMAAHLSNTMNALLLAGSEHVMLVGSQVLTLWSGKARITRVAGHGYVWGMYYVYPTYNPLALGHNLDVREWRKSFDKLVWGLNEGSILAVMDVNCHDHHCDKRAVVFDARAVGWCDEHYSPRRFNKEKDTWERQKNQASQGTML